MEDKKYFKTLLQPKYGEPLSDYDRQITKSYGKKSNRRYNQVPQLGEQPNQTIPPLKVFSKKDEAIAEFVVETGLSKTQLLGKEEHPIHPGPGSKPFVMREPLMWPELLDMLSMRMHELHRWYMKATSKGDVMVAARI